HNSLVTSIREAAEATLQRRKQRKKCNPWWTPALTQAKRELYRARRTYQKCRNDQVREVLRAQYRVLNTEYKSKIRATRKESWGEFVRESNSGYLALLVSAFTKVPR
ncbi:hypothetical protein ACUWC2_28355, partial [Klebsiella pneumoniae]|uniref:hypothetical protein n=1 Tax=Klebsiella pneumoniae TaxID=573 RepID=UPI0040555225